MKFTSNKERRSFKISSARMRGGSIAIPRRALARSWLAAVCPSVQLSEHTQSFPSVQALRAHSGLSVCTRLSGAHTLWMRTLCDGSRYDLKPSALFWGCRVFVLRVPFVFWMLLSCKLTSQFVLIAFILLFVSFTRISSSLHFGVGTIRSTLVTIHCCLEFRFPWILR